MSALKLILRNLLNRFDLDITRHSSLEILRRDATSANDVALLASLPDHLIRSAMAEIPHSQSQLRQDVFVLTQTAFKRDGYFVEFGATDGRTLSNSWLLEKRFGWTGILAEPGHIWKQSLVAERNAHIDFDCVWNSSGETLKFVQAEMAELSTIFKFVENDRHAKRRRSGNYYKVNTVSLNDLLARYQAPSQIDYLSIDTEGSEFEILEAFDFDRYRFNVITCEHNYTENRDKIYKLLTTKGYVRKFDHLSDFDDWYVWGN